jgi:DNA polymerase
MTELHWDVETRSEADLEVVGLANYFDDPSTELIMSQHAIDNGRVHLWQPHLDPKPPTELVEALMDPFVIANAWGAQFERNAARRFLGIHKPINEWRCSMVRARYLSLPGGLDEAGQILGLKESEAKLKEGKRLIKKFCSPETFGGNDTLFGLSAASYRDWNTDPEDWALFCKYGIRDTEAERTIAVKKLKDFPLPDQEWEAWFLDQKINETGWSVDMPLVNGVKFITQKEMERLTARLKELTGLDNPNSVSQILPWLREHNYGFSSLGKPFVARAMSGECDLTEEAKEALLLRGQTSKSAVRKYTNIADMVSADGRLRHQYTFMGAARTGRWAAHGVNMGNLPKPVKYVEKNMQRAIELVRSADYDSILKEFGKPLDVVGSTVRAAFRAPEGMKLVTADLSAIENVGAGFIAHSDPVLRVFREGRDPYLDFGQHFYKMTYAELEAEYDEGRGNKAKRTMCKPATLGSGFGLGAGDEFYEWECSRCGLKKNYKQPLPPLCPECGSVMGGGNKVWTGLLAYARTMGVVMTREEAVKAIDIFRSVYPEIPRTWKDMERAARRAIKNPGKLFGVGVPHTKREEEWFAEKGRKIYDPVVSFLCHGAKVLELKLPSGRSIHYLDPTLEEEKYVWNGKEITSEKISYYGKEQNSTHWGRVPTHGGKIFENADQSWARDILVSGMHEADQAGFEIIGSTYDELITLVPENSPLTVAKLCECMTKKPSWMPDGIPLKAAGYEAKEYKKD